MLPTYTRFMPGSDRTHASALKTYHAEAPLYEETVASLRCRLQPRDYPRRSHMESNMATFKHSQVLLVVVIGLLLGCISTTGTPRTASRTVGLGFQEMSRIDGGRSVHQLAVHNVADTRSLKLNEPDVSLTNYGLAIECSLFAYILYQRRNRRPSLAPWFALFFFSTSVAAFAAGTTHGFFPAGTSGQRVLWPMTMIAIGIAALTLWVIGARLLSSTARPRWLSILAVAMFCIYCIVVVFINQIFLIAILAYLPATFFLLGIFLVRYVRRQEPTMLVGALSLLLTFGGAYVQQAKIGLDPLYFNHNALYHLIQIVALSMFFVSARQLTET